MPVPKRSMVAGSGTGETEILSISNELLPLENVTVFMAFEKMKSTYLFCEASYQLPFAPGEDATSVPVNDSDVPFRKVNVIVL